MLRHVDVDERFVVGRLPLLRFVELDDGPVAVLLPLLPLVDVDDKPVAVLLPLLPQPASNAVESNSAKTLRMRAKHKQAGQLEQFAGADFSALRQHRHWDRKLTEGTDLATFCLQIQ